MKKKTSKQREIFSPSEQSQRQKVIDIIPPLALLFYRYQKKDMDFEMQEALQEKTDRSLIEELRGRIQTSEKNKTL